MKDLLFSEITESNILRDKLIQEIEEEYVANEYDMNETAQDETAFQKMVIEYMQKKGLELTQTNYDWVVKSFQENTDENSKFQEKLTRTKTVNLLSQYSPEELNDIVQLCILRECQNIYKELKASKNEYEYAAVSVVDRNGRADTSSMNHIMNSYAEKGWRVVSSFTNEIGVNSTSVGIGSIASNVNSTVDEVIIIFERKKS